MKNFLFFLALSMLLVGCSSNGSRELQIDEMTYSSTSNRFSGEFNPDEYAKVMSVLDVVPGSYELSWTLVNDLPQLQLYNIALKLKLRLKRHVNVRQDLIDKVINSSSEDHIYLSPFRFVLLDENGVYVDYGAVQDFDLTYSSHDKWAVEGTGNKDQALEFLRFLQSEPGAEIELILNALGSKSGPIDCIKVCKSAKGIICTLDKTDKYFEDYFGTIQ